MSIESVIMISVYQDILNTLNALKQLDLDEKDEELEDESVRLSSIYKRRKAENRM